MHPNITIHSVCFVCENRSGRSQIHALIGKQKATVVPEKSGKEKNNLKGNTCSIKYMKIMDELYTSNSHHSKIESIQ